MRRIIPIVVVFVSIPLALRAHAAGWQKPYRPPCTERANEFAFTEKPKVTLVAKDRYEIAFAVKDYCDVTVGIVDGEGRVVRHLASGVLGANAPEPFRKGSLKQKIYWAGKDDLDRYPRNIEGFRARVSLGLKPEFDKRLGGTSPKNLPGYVWAIALDRTGAYVFAKGPGSHGRVTLRKFDLNGKYVKTLFPPPADKPAGKLTGTGFIEYEEGKRAWHSHRVNETVARNGFIFKGGGGKGVGDCQVAVAGNRLCRARPRSTGYTRTARLTSPG
jgi:hypothetical protein